MNPKKVKTLADIHASLTGKSIEGFLQDQDLDLIASYFQLSCQPNKSQIQLFFSEKLAKREVVAISKEFKERATAFEKALTEWVSSET